MLQLKANLFVFNLYLIDLLIDFINLEMMYAGVKDIVINILLQAMSHPSLATDFILKRKLVNSSY